MRFKRWLILLSSLAAMLLASSIGITRSSFVDLENSTGNAFQAWTSTAWVQTTEDDFNGGVLNNVDTSSSSGDVKLAITSNWYNTNWQYRKKITIDHAKVDANLTDFPVLISLSSDPDLASHAQSDGDDILFASSNGTTKLSHEIEGFDNSTGKLVAWVKLPSLSSNTDTDIYMYYGNSTCGIQENITDVWDSNYKMVQHLQEDPTDPDPAFKDSTSNHNDGSNWGSMNSSDQVIGQVDGSIDFDGINDRINVGNIGTLSNNTFSISVWVKVPNASPRQEMVWAAVTGSSDERFRFEVYDTWINFHDDYNMDTWTSSGTIQAGNWYHVVATYDYPNQKAYIYVDGVLEASDTSFSQAPSTLGALQIGSRDGWYYLNGIIDEVRISDKARSADWIKTCYNNQNSPSTFHSVGDEEGFYVSSGTIASQVLDTAVHSANWYDTDWSYRKRITIDHTKVDADLTDFPVLISLSSDPDLASHAQSDGDDILFASSNGTTKLSHEIEGFDNSTGKLIAWVKAPSLSGSTDTDIYMYYGNSTCGNQEDVTGVWDGNFKGVWHLNQTTGGADAILDSTSNSNEGTDNGNPTLGVAGQIGNAIDFNGTTDYIQVPSSSSLKLAGGLTIEAWINVDSWGNWKNIVFKGDNSASNTDYQFALVTNGLAWDGTLAGTWRTKYFNTPQDTGTWIYVVVTHNTSTVKCYRAGSEISSQSDAGAIYESDVVLGIAAVAYSGTSLLDGKVDEVRISDKARSADWIKTCYNNQNSPSSFYSLGPAHVGTRWDALFWDETLESNTDITFEVRADDAPFLPGSGQPPSWISVGGISPVTSGLPSGRYMQWRATFTTSDTSKTPTLREVRVYYSDC